MLLIDHRHCQKVIFFEGFRNVLFVIIHIQPDIFRMHDVLDLHIVIRNDQRAQRHDPDQLAPGILDITGIDRLCVHTLALDIAKRLADRHFLLQADVLWRHQASSAIVRIIQKAVDQRTLILWRFFEDLIDQIGRQFLQNIDFIVEVKLIHDVAQLRIRNTVYNFQLVIRRQVRKHLDRNILWQQTIHNDRLFDQLRLFQQFLEHFRDVGVVVLE